MAHNRDAQPVTALGHDQTEPAMGEWWLRTRYRGPVDWLRLWDWATDLAAVVRYDGYGRRRFQLRNRGGR